jgi:hypothetical protein
LNGDISSDCSVDPRSLFPDHVIPPPESYNPSRDSLPFVDRVTELSIACKAFAHNMNAGIRGKLNMIIIGQMYGSGKTEFGRHLFDFKDERIGKLFDDVFKLDRPTHQILRETLTVYIDLQIKGSSDGLSLDSLARSRASWA